MTQRHKVKILYKHDISLYFHNIKQDYYSINLQIKTSTIYNSTPKLYFKQLCIQNLWSSSPHSKIF